MYVGYSIYGGYMIFIVLLDYCRIKWGYYLIVILESGIRF